MRRMMTALILSCITSTGFSADETLIIGGVSLSLRMDRAKAWDALRKFRVTCLGDEKRSSPDCDSWFVSAGKEPHVQVLGSVYFSNDGRIKTVMKYYDNRSWEGEPEKFVAFLYEVLRQYGDGKEQFVTTLGEIRQPGWTSKAIDFHNGRKTVRVGYGAGGQRSDGSPYRPFISLHETLE